MQNITFISTVHKNIGKCNAEELYKIVEKLGPEVIFLEALNDTYSMYEKYLFSSFGVYHKKLEIEAIQKYSLTNSFEYIPVLSSGLSDAFDRKYKVVCEYKELQQLINHFNSLAEKNGFKFLNSIESVSFQENMRVLESNLINNIKEENTVNADTDEYENEMFRNIYSYCKNNDFNSAIFMCGAAHRKSIIEKITKFKVQGGENPNWIVFEG